jgi:hypothetical protein
MEGLERARKDLARGDARKARDRLLGLVTTYPRDTEVRGLLAEAYRLDRQPSEAGRWGYLMGPHASNEERSAFERHNAFAAYNRVTEARLRRLLRTDDLKTITDETGRELLRALPLKRPLIRKQGPIESLTRRVAILRARTRWR